MNPKLLTIFVSSYNWRFHVDGGAAGTARRPFYNDAHGQLSAQADPPLTDDALQFLVDFGLHVGVDHQVLDVVLQHSDGGVGTWKIEPSSACGLLNVNCDLTRDVQIPQLAEKVLLPVAAVKG